jgi:hypothetical protein
MLARSLELDQQALKANRKRDAEEQRLRDEELAHRERTR